MTAKTNREIASELCLKIDAIKYNWDVPAKGDRPAMTFKKPDMEKAQLIGIELVKFAQRFRSAPTPSEIAVREHLLACSECFNCGGCRESARKALAILDTPKSHGRGSDG